MSSILTRANPSLPRGIQWIRRACFVGSFARTFPVHETIHTYISSWCWIWSKSTISTPFQLLEQPSSTARGLLLRRRSRRVCQLIDKRWGMSCTWPSEWHPRQSKEAAMMMRWRWWCVTTHWALGRRFWKLGDERLTSSGHTSEAWAYSGRMENCGRSDEYRLFCIRSSILCDDAGRLWIDVGGEGPRTWIEFDLFGRQHLSHTSTHTPNVKSWQLSWHDELLRDWKMMGLKGTSFVQMPISCRFWSMWQNSSNISSSMDIDALAPIT